MGATTTRELLESVLRGDQLAPERLDELADHNVNEDLHLDYKDGAVLKDAKAASRMLREYIAAFANSDGGLLLVGMEDKTRKITGCGAPGNATLDGWAASCLTDLAPYLSPPPRLQVVHHKMGDVLVVAQARAPRLVPLAVNGRVAYYLRLHDQTLRADDYLVSDLLVGHRQRPDFKVETSLAKNSEPNFFGVKVAVENVGLSWADEVHAGVIGFSGNVGREPGPELLKYLDVRDACDGVRLCHVVTSLCSMAPFYMPREGCPDDGHPESIFSFPPSLHYPYAGWFGALYLLARGSPPIWFQLDGYLYCPDSHLDFVHSRIDAHPVEGRPRVEWTDKK